MESSSPTVSATGQARNFESDDEVLNTQDPPSFQPAELSISTPPQNISTPQESPSFPPTTSIQDPSLGKSKNVRKRKAISKFHDDYLAYKREETALICAAIEKSSMRSVERAKKFSIKEAMDAFQKLEGFDLVDFVLASEMFIADSGPREAFLSCNEAISRYKEKKEKQ